MRLPVPSRSPLTLSRILSAIADSLRRHPKRLSSGLAVLLLGTGVTAFGVAPLAPDAADLPVHQVLESVQALPTQTQTDA
ncbi:MAG: M23 family peptidase, partial [Polaromonas sp.]